MNKAKVVWNNFLLKDRNLDQNQLPKSCKSLVSPTSISKCTFPLDYTKKKASSTIVNVVYFLCKLYSGCGSACKHSSLLVWLTWLKDTDIGLSSSSSSGRYLHVRGEAGGRLGERHGRAMGVQHTQPDVAAENTRGGPTGPGADLCCGRPLGPLRPAGERRGHHAGHLWLLPYIQLHQQRSGVQPE